MNNINKIITKLQNAKIIFLKFISANDVGATGAHQSGFYLAKNTWRLFFDSPGIKGQNKDKYVTIRWNDTFDTESRVIYYGTGTRNEYRLTRFGLNFPYLKENNINDLLILIRNPEETFEGFVINKHDVTNFFKESGISKIPEKGSLTISGEDLINKKQEDTIDNEEEISSGEKRYLRQTINSEINEGSVVKKKFFNPKAHILSLLGDELIKSPVMAIYELIKNSYDADAKNVNVYFSDIEDTEEASIVITDDGTGMTSNIIENIWLEPGSDYRKPIDPNTGLRKIIKSPIYERTPMGEKGIGRFAVHKLGSEILLITRPLLITRNNDGKIEYSKLADYEIQLFIDWKEFNQSKHLSEIPISWQIKTSPSTFLFKDTSGTSIHLSGLKEIWTRGMARELKNHTLSMLSPKLEKDSFNINLIFNNEWLAGSPSIDEFLLEAPYKFTAIVDENFNLIFSYQFLLKNNQEIGSREINNNHEYNKNIKGSLRPFLRSAYEKQGFDRIEIDSLLNEFDANLDKTPFGDLKFEFYSYDLDAASLRDYSSDNRYTKTLLREHSGIKVYKGALRVFDYGEKGNDWLGIDLERIQNKEWFSNNQNIGYLYLNPEQSISLIEKTNREGFVHNKAYEIFYIIVKYLLNEFKTIRQVDRIRWLKFNRKVSEQTFDARFQTFKNLIQNAEIKNEEHKQKLITEAEKLEEKYEEDTKILLIPAGVGMTASVALHEIEKLVPRMETTVRQEDIDKDKIRREVVELKFYTDGIISVLRKGGSEETDINAAIERAINNYIFKVRDRNIKINTNLDKTIGNLKVEKRFLITMLMNLLDNSIYWLDTVNRPQRSIFIKSFKYNDTPTIIVADNGPGFKDSISEVVTPFFSRKANGIGIGLYLIDTIMMQYGKFTIIGKAEASDYGVPEEYDGAIVKLVFNKI